MKLEYSEDINNKVIRVWRWHNSKYVKLSWNGFKNQSLVFTKDIKTSILNGSFLLNQDNKLKRKVVVNLSGRVHVEQYL
jgi:hypothetical protein